MFGRLPATPCEVVPMPAHEAPYSTTAFYEPPAADGSRGGRYNVNTYMPATRPRYDAEVLGFHEAVPGHHTQIALSQETAGLPALRGLPRRQRVRRGLGAVLRAARGRARALQLGCRSARHAVVRRLARLPTRRRHGAPRDGLDPGRGDRVHDGEHAPRREQRRERGRPVHRLARTGTRVQARAARDPAAPRARAIGARPGILARRVPRPRPRNGSVALDVLAGEIERWLAGAGE